MSRAADYPYSVCLHLQCGDVAITPYLTYAEAEYAAAIFSALGDNSEAAEPLPKGIPLLYIFPPDDKILSVEILGRQGAASAAGDAILKG